MRNIIIAFSFIMAIFSLASCSKMAVQGGFLSEVTISNETNRTVQKIDSIYSSQEISASISNVSEISDNFPKSTGISKIISTAKSITSYISQTSAEISPAIVETKINFTDPLLEKLMRDYIVKPVGDCYPSDFKILTRTEDNVLLYYDFNNNITSLFNGNVEENRSNVSGMPADFSALSRIPMKNLYFCCFTPDDRDDISLSFDISCIASSKELQSFCFKGLNDIPTRTRLVQHMNFKNFNSLSQCSKLKNLILWDCKGVDLESISNLKNIEYLDLDNCNITNIDALRNFTNLSRLEIHYNNIADFTPLVKCTSLTSIKLTNNISPIDVTTFLTLPKLKVLALTDCISLSSEDIRKLGSNGVTVSEYKTK